jgi:acyl-[acyl carrier protein]--UDP-N-acetylglucosamine O-acyltransferase
MLAEADYDSKVSRVDGLQRYGVDRKSLRTKGLSSQDVDRVFRCLFVYSFGFHSMLKDILSHSKDCSNVVAQFWKVFGMLLEYCSRGDF